MNFSSMEFHLVKFIVQSIILEIFNVFLIDKNCCCYCYLFYLIYSIYYFAFDVKKKCLIDILYIFCLITSFEWFIRCKIFLFNLFIK